MTSDIRHYDDGKPLNRSETLKRQLERDAAKHFLRLYEQEYKTPMRNIWHNEPSRPDISCHLNGKPLDLEIAHLYASASEAKILTREIVEQFEQKSQGQLLDFANTVQPTAKEQALLNYLFELINMDRAERLVTALSRILSSKCEKTYTSPRVWLVIRNASPLWRAHDFERCIPFFHAQNAASLNNPFEQIWLLPEFDGSEAPIRLF